MPMIQWSSGPCPLPPDTPVRVVFNDGFSSVGEASDYSWENETWNDYVTAYEVLTTEPEQPQWEYRVVPMPKYARYPDCSNVLEILAEAGDDGWELAAAPEQYAHFIFKRRKA